jgi:hypothetical protein
MFARIARTAVVVALAAASVVIGLAAPASADGSGPTCATGAFTSYSGLDPYRIHLEGWAQPCAVNPDPGSMFGLTLFTATTGLYHGSFAYNANRNSPASFAATLGTFAGQPITSFRAVCLAGWSPGPISCLKIQGGDDTTFTLTPIALTDPLVTLPIVLAPAGPNPTCGTCV